MNLVEITAPFPYISEHDQSIDRDSPEWDHRQYIETQDAKFCPLRADAAEPPAVFTIKRLSYEDRTVVRRMAERVAEGDANEMACRLALDSVVGFKRNGQIVTIEHDKQKRLKDASLRALGDTLVQEVGIVARTYARLSDRFP